MTKQHEDDAGFTRRDFLHGVGGAGGFAAVYGVMSALGMLSAEGCATRPALTPGAGRGARVLILGGGIAGLTAAYELRKGGYDVRVLEAQARPGGRVFTVRRGSVIEESDSRQTVDWDDDPELFFDAGAARLPAHHQGILGYARELNVPLEVLSNENRNALLQTRDAFDGKPQANRRVYADARGFVAELAAKAIDQASLSQPLGDEDKDKLRLFLRNFGDLDESLVYHGSQRGGFRALPGGGTARGEPLDPLALSQLVRASFWSQLTTVTEGPTQAPTMLRPVGGMAKIAEAVARSLGRLVRYEAEVVQLRREGTRAKVTWRDRRRGTLTTEDADFVLVTIQPGLLPTLDHDFASDVREALAAPTGSPLAKVGFQAKRRFWELDAQIYGGISWTDHSITQIWYPSQGIHGQKGALVGAYVFRDGEEFAKLSLPERIELALAGGEILHPGYRRWVEKGVSISWRKVRWASGGTTHWTDADRRTAYARLLEPDGPYYFAGEYLSYINGWQEGAIQSMRHSVDKIAETNRRRSYAQGKTP
ncbi:MAG: FAD-dependent oxidoreductase [Polyangiales bacterium]